MGNPLELHSSLSCKAFLGRVAWAPY
jgi:hypothetical protein